MRYFNLPVSLSAEPSPPPETVEAAETTRPPAVDPPPKHMVQEHSPSDAPATATAAATPRKERTSVFSMLARLHASFARAEAVHQARLDDFWAGPERHMLGHYTYSAK